MECKPKLRRPDPSGPCLVELEPFGRIGQVFPALWSKRTKQAPRLQTDAAPPVYKIGGPRRVSQSIRMMPATQTKANVPIGS